MFQWLLVILILPFSIAYSAGKSCPEPYTIGAYDEAFSKGAAVLKLGPLKANEVPPTLPHSFLESDGSYGGGEAFCTVAEACETLQQLLNKKVLPMTESWHIYALDAKWVVDIYQLHPQDFRIKHSVRVLGLSAKQC